MRAVWLLVLLTLVFAGGGQAQNLPPSALSFLEIPLAPATNAMGGAAVALPAPDPHAFLANPALLGMSDARLAAASYPGATDWLAGDLRLGSMALSGRTDLRAFGVPLTVGVGLAQTALRFGEQPIVNAVTGESLAAFTPRDRFRALGLGVATEGPVRIGLGGTVRRVVSTDGVALVDAEIALRDIHGYTLDLGAAASVDLVPLVGKPRLGPVVPSLMLTAGYAQANIGGTVGYSGQFGRRPLPRTARVGWSATAGLEAGPLRWLEATMAVQAEHGLTRLDDAGQYRYEPLLGDLALAHATLGHGDEVVTGRRGLRLVLAETVAFSRGHFDGWGFEQMQTHGLELRLAGPLRGLAHLTGSTALAKSAARFDLRITRTRYFADTHDESRFTGLTLLLKP